MRMDLTFQTVFVPQIFGICCLGFTIFQFSWSLPLSAPLRIGFTIDPVQHPADIRQTSSAPGIFGGALTAAEFPYGHNLFHYERTAVIQHILLNVFAGILETITYKIDHLFIP